MTKKANTTPNLRTESGKELKMGRCLGSGGEGEVHEISGDKKLCMKIYHDKAKARKAKLATMMSRKLSNWLMKRIGWPIEFVIDADTGEVVGFTMRKIKGRPILEAYQPSDPTRRLSRRARLRIAKEVAQLVAMLHPLDIVVADLLNEENLIILPDGHVGAIDCDSWQIPDTATGKYHLCTVGRPTFVSPQTAGVPLDSVTRTKPDDCYALALLIYSLISDDGAHPFECQYVGSGNKLPIHQRIKQGICPLITGPNGDYHPPSNSCYDAMPSAIQNLLRRTIVDGHDDPSKRPTAEDWASVLKRIRPSRLPRSPLEQPNPLAIRCEKLGEHLVSLGQKVIGAYKQYDWSRPMNIYRVIGKVSLLGGVVAVAGIWYLSNLSPTQPDQPESGQNVAEATEVVEAPVPVVTNPSPVPEQAVEDVTEASLPEVSRPTVVSELHNGTTGYVPMELADDNEYHNGKETPALIRQLLQMKQNEQLISHE